MHVDNKKPVIMDDFYEGDKCDVDYEILGLWSISKNMLIYLLIVITIICSCIVIVLIFIVVIWIYAQKNRSIKRARLQSSLMSNADKNMI